MDPLPPDESYIERLFPKCAPRQARAQQGGQQQQQGQRRRQTRRQTRSAIQQQHARAELDARNRQQDHRPLVPNDSNRAHSSGSSDEQQGNGGRLLRRANHVTQNGSNPRRSGKYMASQSLLQQLQRSQSSYNNTLQDQPQPVASSSAVSDIKPKVVSGHERGIIKSTSVYSSFPLPSTSSNNNNNGDIFYSSQQPSTSQLINYKTTPEAEDDDDIEENGEDSTLKRIAPSNGIYHKLDNSSQSDLRLDNEFKTSNNNVNGINNNTGLVRGGSSKDGARYNESMGCDQDESSYGELISKLDKRNNRAKYSREFVVDQDEDKIDDLNVSNNNNEFNMAAENVATLAPTTSATSVPMISSASADSTTTTAFKRSSVSKIDVTTAKVADLISINEPDEEDSNDTCGAKVDLAKSLFKNESAAQRDDDQYINLFVYDNNSPASATTTNTFQQPKPNQESQTLPTTTNKPNNSNSQKRRQGTKNKQLAKGNRFQRRSKLVGEVGDGGCSTRKDIKSSTTTTIASAEDQNKCNTSLESPFVSELIRNEESETSSTTDKYNQEHQSATILPIHHSQQLLTTSVNDDEDEDETGVVRNDASTEELCSNDDQVEESRKGLLKREDHTKTNAGVNFRVQPTLQTVDERAEINTEEEEEGEELEEDEEDQVDEDEEGVEVEDEGDSIQEDTQDKTNLRNQAISDGSTMPTNQRQPVGLKKKACVPPGYPKRIGYNPSNLSVDYTLEPKSTPSRDQQQPPTTLTLASATATSTSLVTGTTKPIKVVEPTNQRVKFDESNLVSVKYHNNDGHQERGANQMNHTINSNAERVSQNGGGIGGLGGRRVGEHHHQHHQHHQAPQMPIISETNYESEESAESPTLGLCNDQQQTTTESSVVETEQDLSLGLNKISFASSTPHSSYNQLESQIPSNYNYQQSNTNLLLAPQPESFHQPTAKTELQQASSGPNQMDQPILRHHKLPNESSHFSTVRNVGLVGANNNNVDLSSRVTSHVQFNTLSDVDSGTDDPLITSIQQNQYRKRMSPAAPGVAIGVKKCDLSTTTTTGNTSISNSSSLLGSSSSSSRNCIDDDLAPAAKTALIFPRLDEGLSSDPESYEDDNENDEEKAVDGDVDADDEEEEGEKNRGSVVGTSVDLFMRQQQQQQNQVVRPQNRITSNLQQQVSSDPLDLHQMNKSQQGGSSYQGHSVYMNQDPLDHNDLNRTAAGNNYSNQNGQSNYWLSNQQQPQQQASSSQQQQFIPRNNISSSGMASKQAGNNSFDRDEAKATNRLSSDTDNETDRLLGTQRSDQLKQMVNNDVANNSATSDLQNQSSKQHQSANSKEVLIEGVLFNVKFLGTTESLCEGQTSKEERVKQAEMAVHEVRFLNGESQVAIEVQLFISTEKIMVLDDKHRKILMDHSLKTISYIADIGDFIVLIVKKKYNPTTRTNTSCHVFESSESHTITKSIDQAFQVAYADLLKAHGNLDGGNYLPKETDYQEVLNSQEMSTDELEMFARKENQREVIVPKEKGEILGLSIVESGWGSVLPTVVIASLKPEGPAYRCKKLSVGDQILSINGISLVGLPLADCQEILRKTKNQRVARFSVVPCPITVEVKIKRPDTKYQLGFSVQNGVICSLLRGGIAERGGVRVGHRIMSINGTTVVNVPHEKIVSLLASSVGEIKMKTCLTSLYRLILGEENPVHF